jgi:predicted CXXCH cytochrome family protein
VETGGCDACHENTDQAAHKFKLTQEGAALCTDCHDEDDFTGKVIHSPVKDGQCTACHDPHGSKAKGLLTADDVGALCADCHDDTLEDLKFIHGPAAVGQCTSCHMPHVSEHPSLLRAEGKSLCLDCHDDINERMKSAKHVHQPVESDCTSCHKPHGADNKFMLTASPPGMCLDCHDDIAELAKDAACKHSPVTTDKACMACHDAHTSAASGLVLAENSMKLCLTCHEKEIKIGERMIASIGDAINDVEPHGPIRDGDCTACHAAHGGERFSLLSNAYPPRFYARFENDAYALCLDCHEPEAFENAETEDATEFRNGKQNLHHLHVNKQKGRTCRACHDPHGSNKPHHMRTAARFGQWNIPVNFTPTEGGGTCQAGCHKSYTYSRDNPVSNLPPVGTN